MQDARYWILDTRFLLLLLRHLAEEKKGLILGTFYLLLFTFYFLLFTFYLI